MGAIKYSPSEYKLTTLVIYNSITSRKRKSYAQVIEDIKEDDFFKGKESLRKNIIDYLSNNLKQLDKQMLENSKWVKVKAIDNKNKKNLKISPTSFKSKRLKLKKTVSDVASEAKLARKTITEFELRAIYTQRTMTKLYNWYHNSNSK